MFAQDNFGGSGVEKITYSATGAQSIAETTYNPNSKPVIKNDGTTTISYYATDKAGNVQDPKSLTIKIDKTNPVTTLEAVTEDGSYETGTLTSKDVTLNLSATDESGSGVGSITYKVTNGGQDLAGETVSGDTVSIPVTTEGENTITYYATNLVGHKAAAQTFTVKLDKSAPTLDPTNADSVEPDNEATGVSRDVTPEATFSEELEPASLTASVKLYQRKSGKWRLVRDTQVRCEDLSQCTTVMLDPYGTSSTLLAANKKYKVVITIGAKNLAGIPLSSNKSWTFTTGP